MSTHHIDAIHDPDGAQLETRIHFVFHAYVAMRGPSYASGGEPPEPASVEYSKVQREVDGKWVDAPEMDDWAENYLMTYGIDEAFEMAHDDRIAAKEYAAEMRAEGRREAQERDRSDRSE